MPRSRVGRHTVGGVAAMLLAVFGLLLIPAAPAAGEPSNEPPRKSMVTSMLDPVNLQRTTERAAEVGTADIRRGVAEVSAAAAKERAELLLKDPERRPDPNACTLTILCVGDPRLYDFPSSGGAVEAVLFTARSGATLSGHVWADNDKAEGPRPLIVIVNGSLIDFEQGHWAQAQSLAKSGYVVLTFDVQGEGMSDASGVGADALDTVGAGLPGLPANGRPFYDGAVDAIDFALSTPTSPYRPRPARTSGTSHADKQDRRVSEGLNAAFNPLWQLVDRDAVGLAGYSYGAVAASYVAQDDPRVGAVVAWDSLCFPVQPSADEVTGLFLSNNTEVLPGLVLPLAAQIPHDCFGAPEGDLPKPHAAALGISGDIVLPGLPQSTDAGAKAAASRSYTKSGVDSGQIVIQGATHVDFTLDASIPLLPARLRGHDLTIWYTIAWFDKYLRDDRSADRRLMSSRWRDDAATAAVDPVGDGNMFSQVYDSRLSITRDNGKPWACEDLRNGCPDMRVDGGPAFDDVAYINGSR